MLVAVVTALFAVDLLAFFCCVCGSVARIDNAILMKMRHAVTPIIGGIKGSRVRPAKPIRASVSPPSKVAVMSN